VRPDLGPPGPGLRKRQTSSLVAILVLTYASARQATSENSRHWWRGRVCRGGRLCSAAISRSTGSLVPLNPDALHIQDVKGGFARTQTLDDAVPEILIRQEADGHVRFELSAGGPPQGAQTVQDSSRSTAALCVRPHDRLRQKSRRFVSCSPGSRRWRHLPAPP